MKVIGWQFPFQYMPLEKEVEIIKDTFGVDFVRSPTNIWKCK